MCYGKCQGICDRPCQKAIQTQDSTGFTSLTLSAEPRNELKVMIEDTGPITIMSPTVHIRPNFIDYKLCA